ncbi:MAG: YkgJ family cysteine cluster protein [Myxococcota bacterium]
MSIVEPVPLLMTPAVRQWRCQMRGACCKIHRVPVEDLEARRIARALRAEGDARADVMEKAMPMAAGVAHLPMTPDMSCIFLGADNRCDLRRVARPRPIYPSICQQFPYLSMLTPEHHVFGLTLQCPTALENFAQETSFDLVTEPPDSEPPCDRLLWLGQEDREYWLVSGAPTDRFTFWRTHWDWLERFRARPETNPIERLTRFAEEVTGSEAPPVAMLSRSQWKQSAFEGSLPRQLERLSGVEPEGLEFLWVLIAEEKPPTAVPNTDEDGLLLRYLLHRFVIAPSYLQRTDHAFLLTTLFAMCCRYRIERARGSSPILAIRELDRLFIHLSGTGASIGSGHHVGAWRPLCSLANAATV